MREPDPEQILESLAARRRLLGDEVALRGTGKARFVYITRGKQAAEASIDKDGAVWVEYWSDSLNEHAPASKDATFATIEAAEDCITKWFEGGL